MPRMKQPRYEEMSKTDLLQEIYSVQAALGTDGSLLKIAQDLQVHQEEVRAQQSQLIESQHALEESRDRYADLFDFAPVGYVTIDRSGILIEANLAAAAMLGIERRDLLGFPLAASVVEADRRSLLEHLHRCRDGRQTIETRVRLQTRSGSVFPANLVSRLANVGAGGSHWHTAIIDLTAQEKGEAERQRAEEERLRLLRQEQSLRAAAEAKDRFLAILSHELRTPLTPIVFTLGLLEARCNLPDELRDALSVIRRNVDIEAKLIDDLLDTSRIASGKLRLELETVDLRQAVEEVLAICAAEIDAARVVVALHAPAVQHHVRGDATRLRQVLWNLVTNAIHHTPREGRIDVRLVNPETDRVRVIVEDEGTGMEASLIRRLFEPFSQGLREGSKAGLGLGLAISKGILDAHGGTIAAFSEGPGSGARFEVELATVVPEQRPAETAPVAAPAGVEPRILLVEDHPDTAEALGRLLEIHGFRVTVATSFTTALEHRDEVFDALVTDIGLPDGDGIDLLRELSPAGTLPAIALSGYGAGADVERSRRAGFRMHLTKPVDASELVRAIARVAPPSA
jgi:PAS domain S-box-containing protein